MQPAQGGRHCASCQKVVVDFTRMTDAQLLDYFRKNNGSCGRFRSDQLDRAIQEVVVPKSNWWARVAAGILLALGLSKNADGQTQNNKANVEQHLTINHEAGEAVAKDTTTGGIYGTLKDEKGVPIINANVEVSKDGIVVGREVTDLDGNYFIKPLSTGIYEVKFSYQALVQIINLVAVKDEVQKVCATMDLFTSGHQLLGVIRIIHVGRQVPEPPGQHTFRSGDNLSNNW